jgi:curved DNA-binding protein
MDYYKTLGVERNATPEEIKKAYRKMAAKYHPDREGGDTAKFQEVEEAYRNLSDPQLKQQHDNPSPFGQGGQNPFGDFHFNFGGGNPFDDIFRQFNQQRQRIYTVAVEVTLKQVATGDSVTVQIQGPTGPKTIQINVPKNVETGQNVRYDGIMPDGILQVEFRVRPHPELERRGLDLYCTRKLSVFELLLGTTIKVTTIWGDELEATVPPRTNSGASLRLAGRGLEANGFKGNQFVLLQGVAPDTISDELLEAIKVEVNKSKGI